MIRFELRFLAGRYHATPWSSHVNEGDIEWPPSPWRLARALVATGFAKLGWSEVPDVARRVIGRLASTPPTYHLPPASTGHTRHYMWNSEGKTAKVLDAFAYPGRGDEGRLWVTWDIDADHDEHEILSALVPRIAYLGRAESWVEARLTEDEPTGEVCEPAEAAPRPGLERVPLLALLPEGDYAKWHAVAVDRALTERFAEKRAAQRAKGKPEPKKLSKADATKATAIFPETAFDVLMLETGALHAAGWREPPGTRWLSYWRRTDALTPRAKAPVQRRAGRVKPTMAVLALASDTEHGGALPRFEDALPLCEWIHGKLVSRLPDPDAEDAWIVTGQLDGRPARGHEHIALHPFGRKSDDRIDHILVHAPAGLGDSALRALRRVRQLGKTREQLGPDESSEGQIALFLSLVGVGAAEEIAALAPLGPARVWRSVTPYVPPRHLKAQPSGSLENMVLRELGYRELPRPTQLRIAVDGADGAHVDASRFWPLWQLQRGRGRGGDDGVRLATRWRHFATERQRYGKPRPVHAGAFGLELRFDEPVTGPIALGYGSHFGLGLLRPIA